MNKGNMYSQDTEKKFELVGNIVGRVGYVPKNYFEAATDNYGNLIYGQDGLQKYRWPLGLLVDKKQQGQTGIEKAEGLDYLFHCMQKKAQLMFPKGVPQNFSWKYRDCDTTYDQNNCLYSEKDGFAGHYLFSFDTTLGYDYVKKEQGMYTKCHKDFKSGDYVRIFFSINGQDGSKKLPTGQRVRAGLYVNPKIVEFVAHGRELIKTAYTPDKVFSEAAVLPEGAEVLEGIPSQGASPMGFQGPLQPPQGPPQQMVPQGPPQQAAPLGPQQVAPQGPPQQAAPLGPPQQVAPQGPQQAAPQGPQQAAPLGPQQVAPQGPQQAAPQGPQQAAPQGPQQAAPLGPQQAAPQGPQQAAPQPVTPNRAILPEEFQAPKFQKDEEIPF